MIDFQCVSAGYRGDPVLSGISFQVPAGSFTTIVGPNGCGKTTLLRSVSRQIPLLSGEIQIENRSIGRYGRKEYARTAAFLPQVRSVPSITVRRLVSHGRFPYLGFSRKMGAEDRRIVDWAMEETGVAQWANRDLRELSGGERQRAYIAMALAQDTKVIFFDEPTTYLDLRYQFEMLELIKGLDALGKTLVLVLHDLAHAIRYSDQIVVMEQGKIVTVGAPEQVLGSGALERVFQIRILRTPMGVCTAPA